jgi:hypothetical protein
VPELPSGLIVPDEPEPEDVAVDEDDSPLFALKKENNARSTALIERTQGAFSPLGAEPQRIAIYLRHLLIDAGRLEEAETEYEEWRKGYLDKGEKLADKIEAQARTQRILGNGPLGRTPLGNRAQRRHPR